MIRRQKIWILAKYGDGKELIFQPNIDFDYKGFTTKEGKNVYRRIYWIERIYRKHLMKKK